MIRQCSACATPLSLRPIDDVTTCDVVARGSSNLSWWEGGGVVAHAQLLGWGVTLQLLGEEGNISSGFTIASSRITAYFGCISLFLF